MMREARYSIIRGAGNPGTGNWKAYSQGFDIIKEAALEWKKKLEGVQYPWLCWNVDDRWCYLQQKLVQSVGWTPVVGNDTNVKNPTILDGAIYIDFNKKFKLPVMQMQFPLEFVFLYTDRMAFWHSDFIMSLKEMEKHAKIFSQIKDGEMAVTWTLRGPFGFKFRKTNRIFELIGCTTAKASEDQYNIGCGWWRNTAYHPNFKLKKEPFYDHGTGITIWQTKFGGKVIDLYPDEKNGHASNYLLKGQPKKENARSKAQDMNEYYSLNKIAKKLDVMHLLNEYKSR